MYYKKHFPHEVACKLLGRAWRGVDALYLREVAVETNDDVYIRWLSVSSPAELRNTLAAKNTCKVHIGAIFDAQPIHRKRTPNIKATQRELVFDIDVNDYGNIGADANDVDTCDTAWPVVAFGMMVVKAVMRDKFGFANMLTVYSGRRGAHLTVYDARACELSDESRASIVAYMQPSDKQTESGRPVYGNIMSDAFFGELWDTHILPFWTNYCIKSKDSGGGGFLDQLIDCEDFMQILDINDTKQKLSVATMRGDKLWAFIWQYALKSKFKDKTIERVKHTVLSYVWPRLDANVSTKRNHLAKAWFSLHPKTGRLCVPIFGNPGLFDPAKCPRLEEVVAGNPTHCQAFQHAVSGFSKFVERLEQSSSETWKPPRIQMPLPRVYSMVSQKRSRDEPCCDYVFTNSRRICYSVERVFCAIAHTAEPNQVSFMWHTVPTTEAPEESVSVIYPGYSPPCRSTVNFPMHKFLAAVDKASQTPDEAIECDRAYVCVLLHPRNQDMDRAVQRFKRMCPGLTKHNLLGSVNFKWDSLSKEAVVKTMVRPVWDTGQIHL